jgi:agmatinase
MMPSVLSFATLTVLAVSSTRGEQTPLNSGREGVASTDYADLFSADRQIANAPPWTRESWNGLVSFARAPPLRCWGAEADVPYDIAIIGEYVI